MSHSNYTQTSARHPAGRAAAARADLRSEFRLFDNTKRADATCLFPQGGRADDKDHDPQAY